MERLPNMPTSSKIMNKTMQGNITDEDIKYGFNLHIVQPMQLMMIQYYYISVCKVLCT